MAHPMGVKSAEVVLVAVVMTPPLGRWTHWCGPPSFTMALARVHPAGHFDSDPVDARLFTALPTGPRLPEAAVASQGR